MGGAGLFAPPVKEWAGIASWTDHTERWPKPSEEPGIDWYCPIGTELHAAASGVVVEINTWNVGPATGLFITINLDNGQRVRYLHLSAIFVVVGQRVAFDEIIGKTGATGYGTWDWSGDPSTGGAHVHETIFPGHYYVFGQYATLDPWPLTDTTVAEKAAEPKKDDDVKILANELGGQKFVDEFGADDIGEFFFTPNGPDNSPSWVDNIHAAWKLAGDPVQANGWDYELARHQANARWNRKRAQIVQETASVVVPAMLAALTPLIKAIAPTVDLGALKAAVASAVDEALDDVTITSAPISDADRDKIAKTTVDLLAKRAAD